MFSVNVHQHTPSSSSEAVYAIDSAYGHEECVAISSVPVPLIITVKKQKSRSLPHAYTMVTSITFGSIDTQLKQFQKDLYFSILSVLK